jgi:hypothetical protein
MDGLFRSEGKVLPNCLIDGKSGHLHHVPYEVKNSDLWSEFLLKEKVWGLLFPNPQPHSSPSTVWGILDFSHKLQAPSP